MSTVQSRKAKGRNLQKLVIEMIIEASDGRLRNNEFWSCPMGSQGEDIRPCTDKAARLFPYSVEAKARRDKVPIHEAIRQSRRNCNDRTPVAIFKRDRGAPYLAIEKAAFDSLAQQVLGEQHTEAFHVLRTDSLAIRLWPSIEKVEAQAHNKLPLFIFPSEGRTYVVIKFALFLHLMKEHWRKNDT